MNTFISSSPVTNLDPTDAYQFRVRAANEAGFGPSSRACTPIQLSATAAAVVMTSSSTVGAVVNGEQGGGGEVGDEEDEEGLAL